MIDPNISLRGRGVQMFNPVTKIKSAIRAGEAEDLKLRDLLNSQKLREMQLGVQQEGIDRDRGFRQALAGGANANMLQQIDPERAMELESKQAVSRESQRKIALAKLARIGQIAGAIRSEAEFGPGIQQMVSEGLVAPEQAQAMMQTPWVEAQSELQRLAQQSMTVAEQLAQQEKAAALRQQRNAAGVTERNQTATRMEQERHNRATEAASAQPRPTGDLAEFKSVYLPGWYESKGEQPSAAGEMQAYREFLKEKRAPATQIPGRDIPYPPEVEAQRKRMGSQGGAPGSTSTDPQDIAGAIMRGDQPPVLTGLYRNASPVRAELARKGYDLTKATLDWQGTARHMQTLNGSQQLRVRQALGTLEETIPLIKQRYAEWKKTGLPGGFRLWNKASLVASANLPGESGAAARAVIQLVNDAIPELANIYMGGNSPTDHALKVASSNLSAEWNQEQFERALANVEETLKYRKNSIAQSQPMGTSAGNEYWQGQGGAGSTGGQGAPPPAPTKRKVWNPQTNRFEEK